MSDDAKPYTSEELRLHRTADDTPSRLRATVEALERVTKERDELHEDWCRAMSEANELTLETQPTIKDAVVDLVRLVRLARRETHEARTQLNASRAAEEAHRGIRAETLKANENLQAERDAALAACAEMRAALESALPFLDDHAKDMADLAAGWPENPDGPGAAATARNRVERVRSILSSEAGRGWVSPEEHARVVLERDQAQMDYATLLNAKRGER